jgi:putative membrane protein
VNSLLLWMTDKLIEDFEITGLGPLLGTAGLISLATWLLPRLF